MEPRRHKAARPLDSVGQWRRAVARRPSLLCAAARGRAAAGCPFFGARPRRHPHLLRQRGNIAGAADVADGAHTVHHLARPEGCRALLDPLGGCTRAAVASAPIPPDIADEAQWFAIWRARKIVDSPARTPDSIPMICFDSAETLQASLTSQAGRSPFTIWHAQKIVAPWLTWWVAARPLHWRAADPPCAQARRHQHGPASATVNNPPTTLNPTTTAQQPPRHLTTPQQP